MKNLSETITGQSTISLTGFEARGGNRANVLREVEEIYKQLAALQLQRLPRRQDPPQGKSHY
jgi:hypothetical protein